MLPPKAVIFDMDGLMLDTETISLRSMRQAMRILKLPVEDQWLYDIIGMNGAGAYRYLEEKIGQKLPAELDQTFITIYEEQVSRGVQLKIGLIDLFKYLERHNIRRAVATSTRTRMARKKLALTGIDHWFEHIVCGDQVENGKPAPDIYLQAADQLGINTKHCLALEDSDNGAMAAYRAGIKVIVVPDMKQPNPKTKLFAHRVANDLHEVREYLEEQPYATSQRAS